MKKKLTQEQQRELDGLLYHAAQNGKLFLVKFLIDFGADIHAWNDVALCSASQYGHFDVVKCLVEYGANIHLYHDYAIVYAKTKEIKEYLKSQT